MANRISIQEFNKIVNESGFSHSRILGLSSLSTNEKELEVLHAFQNVKFEEISDA